MKKKGQKLPETILPIKCKDKGFQERWYEGRSLLNIPHSFRAIFAGPPSCGKTNFIKNLIIRADPQFEQILITHFSPQDTIEWSDVDANMLASIPCSHEISSEGKKLLIIEDLDLNCLSKSELHNLDRLYGYCSSHKSLSIILTCQNPYNVPPCARRTSNVFVFFKQPDITALATLAKRTGMKAIELLDIFSKYIHSPHDSLMIDYTNNTPAPLRINGFTKIDKKNV
jgi:hypothetical protein